MQESDTPQRQDSSAKDANQSKNKGTDDKSVPASSKVLPTANKPNDSDNTDNLSRMKAWMKNHITATLVVELLVLIVGIRVACIYSQQLDQMVESNILSRKSLESVQRAFLNFSKFNYSRVEEGKEAYWQMDIPIEDSGATAAVPIINYISAQRLPSEPDEVTFRGPENDFYASSLGPKEQQTIGPLTRTEHALFGEDFDIKIRDPKPRKGPFIWSWIAYRDIFGAAHVTEFCAEVQLPMLLNKSTQEIRWNLKNCHNHNCTDKYCPDFESLTDLLPKSRE
jgi:hypothetical protein